MGCLALLTGASRAHAGLDLSWRSCGAARGDSTIFLDCANPDSVVVLHGCFQVPDTLRGVAAITAILDVAIESDRIPGFWRLEPGGCNQTGIGFLKDPPEDGCPGAVSPWGSGMSISGLGSQGRQEDSTMTRIRLLGAIAQSYEAPVTLIPGTNYYGFQIRFFTDKAREAGDVCDGCGTPVAIRWTGLKIESVPVGGKRIPPTMLTGRGRGADHVGLNGPRAASFRALRRVPLTDSAMPDPAATQGSPR